MSMVANSYVTGSQIAVCQSNTCLAMKIHDVCSLQVRALDGTSRVPTMGNVQR